MQLPTLLVLVLDLGNINLKLNTAEPTYSRNKWQSKSNNNNENKHTQQIISNIALYKRLHIQALIKD